MHGHRCQSWSEEGAAWWQGVVWKCKRIVLHCLYKKKVCIYLCVCVCVAAKRERERDTPSFNYLAWPAWATINFHVNHRGLGMNSGTVFKLCVPLHVCSRLCLRVTFAGTRRDKAPSARSRLSWLPAPLSGPEERLSVSIVMKPTLLLFLLRCLLVLTANNVLLDDCALLEPQSRDRD